MKYIKSKDSKLSGSVQKWESVNKQGIKSATVFPYPFDSFLLIYI